MEQIERDQKKKQEDEKARIKAEEDKKKQDFADRKARIIEEKRQEQ